jgi:beta-galactosidase
MSDTSLTRSRLLLDLDWRFHLGDPAPEVVLGASASASLPVPAAAGGDGVPAWRTVDLPHDWSIEGDFDAASPTGAVEAFLPQGVAWYRRAFAAPAAWRARRVTLHFEGVYMHARVWLNGRELGSHPYGYTPFEFDLTPHLDFAADNILAVRVDSSAQKNSRWYPGCGLYRPVWLTVTDPVHIPTWGVFPRTVAADSVHATVAVETTVATPGSGLPPGLLLETVLLSDDGHELARATSALPAATAVVSQTLAVAAPPLWSTATPRLCSVVSRLRLGERLLDETTTPFGIRSLDWSAAHGLRLNGQPIKLHGGNVHHDHGCLGSASYAAAEERRVLLLKAAGFNAVRTAHNPPSVAFLDACDRHGLLVLDEIFDCWEKPKNPADYARFFPDHWASDLDAFIRRDRHHPSVIAWSIGNEIPEQYTPRGREVGLALAARIRSLDTSRPVTNAFFQRPKPEQLADWDALCAGLDVIGYNYNLADGLREDLPLNPGRVFLSTETFLHETFTQWRAARDHASVLGEFVWTALDYEGEGGIGRWVHGDPEHKSIAADVLFPWHGAQCGVIDSLGVPRPTARHRDVTWNATPGPHLAVRLPLPPGETIWVDLWGLYPRLPSWTWPGHEDRPVTVEVYARADLVRLYLDGALVGESPATEAQCFCAEFTVPYRPGILTAVALRRAPDGGWLPLGEDTLRTAATPAALRLEAPATLPADRQGVAHVLVTALDARGVPALQADTLLTFSVTGPAELLGVANGDLSNLERYQASTRTLHRGRALAVLRATGAPGEITLTVTGPGLAPAVACLHALPPVAPTPRLA